MKTNPEVDSSIGKIGDILAPQIVPSRFVLDLDIDIKTMNISKSPTRYSKASPLL